MKLKIITAIYGFLIGAAMIATWVMLFATGQAEEIGVRFGFHLFSEFATAALLVAAGILVIAGRGPLRKMTYLGFGMVLNATAGAVVFYIVNPNAAILVMTAVALAFTLVLTILNYERVMDLVFLVLGVVLYGCLNIIGDAWQNMRWGPLTYILLMFALGVILSIFLFRKKAQDE